MKKKLMELKKVKADNCVTIIMNTHRTAPDSQKDSIQLKNLIKEAIEKLNSINDKKLVEKVTEHLNNLVCDIDFDNNLDAIALFVNAEERIEETVQLPLSVVDRVIVDDTFATRDLLRAENQVSDYYILALSQQKVRLLHASNDQIVSEYKSPFPIKNTEFYTTSGIENSNAPLQTNLLAEFFNRVDKEVNKIRKENDFPVLIATEEGNFYEYLKIADEKDSIYELFLNGNRLEEKDHELAKNSWPIVQENLIKDMKKHKNTINEAVGHGKFLSDASEIWRNLEEGRVKTLFVEENLFQSAVVENGGIRFVEKSEETSKNIVADIYDDMIEKNMEQGGTTVFLPTGELEEYQGFAATLRY